jgi:Gas vesicle synthesis protein GvpL/GvpF
MRLYGIIDNDAGASEALPAGVQLASYRELAAVVAEVPAGRRGPAPPDIDVHRSVVTALFAHRSVVPVPPGVVFRRLDTLTNWLELHYAPLIEAVRYVHGRAEARVHVRCAGRAVEARSGHPHSPGKSPQLEGRAFEVFHEVSDHASAWSLVPPSAQQTRDVDDISASFLVERSRWHDFTEAVAVAARRASGLEIALSGPWPPYDFVRLKFGG